MDFAGLCDLLRDLERFELRAGDRVLDRFRWNRPGSALLFDGDRVLERRLTVVSDLGSTTPWPIGLIPFNGRLSKSSYENEYKVIQTSIVLFIANLKLQVQNCIIVLNLLALVAIT